MAKILLVEDDNNLREIYEARLQAEGYDIVVARDGEEALTVAMKERPDLIISDVMMPKISGFDMLDIIRSTEETKDVKVIMMTALSQAEDKARADKLGADRYLVKSQVTLEDVAKVAREVLNGTNSASSKSTSTQETPATSAPTPPVPAPQQAAQPSTAAPVPVALPVVPVAAVASTQLQPAPGPIPVAVQLPTAQPTTATASTTPLSDDAQTLSQPTNEEQADITAQIDSFIDSSRPAQTSTPEPASTPQEPSTTQTPLEIHQEPTEANSTTPAANPPQRTGKKIIQPLNDPTSSKGPDLNKLLEKERERDQMAAIAQDIASKKTETSASTESTEKTSEVDDESAAEEALRVAAEHMTEGSTVDNPAAQNAPAESEPHAPEVAISEDGNLHLASVPETQTTQASSNTNPTPSAMSFEEAPVSEATSSASTAEPELAEAAAQLEQTVQQTGSPAPQQSQPNIPHTNGTNIDGVSAQPSTAAAQQQPAAPEESSDNPDDIAL